MARAHFVKKARKDNPVVKAGESYWWWQFKGGSKRFSAKKPRPSQLTQSEYLSTVRGLLEQVEDFETEDPQDLDTLKDEIIGELQQLCEAAQESLDNMPEGLQQGPTGEMLQERVDACESAISDLEGIDFEFTPSDDIKSGDEWEEERDSFISEKKMEMEEFISGCDIG